MFREGMAGVDSGTHLRFPTSLGSTGRGEDALCGPATPASQLHPQSPELLVWEVGSRVLLHQPLSPGILPKDWALIWDVWWGPRFCISSKSQVMPMLPVCGPLGGWGLLEAWSLGHCRAGAPPAIFMAPLWHRFRTRFRPRNGEQAYPLMAPSSPPPAAETPHFWTQEPLFKARGRLSSQVLPGQGRLLLSVCRRRAQQASRGHSRALSHQVPLA